MRSDLLDKALETLKLGGTLLYPTDTIWGIGCDACCREAVDRIYSIKERDHSKSMLVLANEGMLSPTLPYEARKILLCSNRPTTVILQKKMLTIEIADNLPAADGTIGVRIPRFDFCQTLLTKLGHPIVSTSANLSGSPSPACYDEIAAAVMERVDYALPNDDSFIHSKQASSRIVKLFDSGKIEILRE